MHANQRNQDHMPASAFDGTGRKSRKTMRLAFAANGTFFEIQGDIRDDGGINLHLATDSDAAELTIRCVAEDAALQTLRIFRDYSV